MHPFVRKLYTLPGIWSLFTVPVMASSFMRKNLQQGPERPRRCFIMFMALCVLELSALAACYVCYFTGHAETTGGYLAGGLFLTTALILIVVSQLYARRHKAAFNTFLVEQGYAANRPELLSPAKQ